MTWGSCFRDCRMAAALAAILAFCGCSGSGDTIDPDSVLQLVAVSPAAPEVDVDLRTLAEIADPLTTQEAVDFYVTVFCTARISDSTVTTIPADDIQLTRATLTYTVGAATWSRTENLDLVVHGGASAAVRILTADAAFQITNLAYLVGTTTTASATMSIRIEGERVEDGVPRVLNLSVPIVFKDIAPTA